MLNFVMTCFLFGAGVPLLFPIALVCLVILYIFEKKSICKQVPQPIDYDHEMNERIKRVILTGPILYGAIGFWMFSNPAIFSNDVVPKKFYR